MFEAELYDVILENESENGTTPLAIISEKLVDISKDSGNASYLEFNTDGEFSVETSDLTELGRKELRICARLI